MDILAHSLWASAGAQKINDNREKKHQNKISIIWSALWGIFPDLFAFGIPTLISFWAILSGNKPLSSLTHHSPTLVQGDQTFNLASYLYQYSHSLVIFLVVFFLVWFLWKKPWLPMLGWGLHILIDIPSHTLEFFPTPFLFPISEYRFPYGIHWSSPTFMIVNYALLLVALLYFTFRKKINNVIIKSS